MGFRINSMIVFINTMYTIKTLFIKLKEYKSVLTTISKMQTNTTLRLNINSQRLSNTKNKSKNILELLINNHDIYTLSLF